MDVIIEKKTAKRGYYIYALVGLFTLGLSWLSVQPNAAEKINAAEVWVGQVQQGDMALSVSGFGTLKSKKTRLLTAYSNAVVDQILLRPGAVVNPDTVVLKLFDPAIEQAVKDAERELQQSKNQYLQLGLNQTREHLSQQSELELLRAALESAELEVSAQSQLIEQGIVSHIEYQRSVLEQRQLARRLDIEQKRIGQLAELHSARLSIAQSNIQAREEALTLIKQNQQRLVVKAGMSGVMQALAVELGQSVSSGQQLALIGSKAELYGLINIPQAQMQQVKLAQKVSIDTRNGFITGTVTRIEPVVTNGSLQVEVSLESELTSNARPELNVAAVIDIGRLENVLFMKKPINSQANGQGRLFRLTESGEQAVATTLQYGAETKDTIQIVSGATLNQRFILSDTSRWQQHQALSLVQ